MIAAKYILSKKYNDAHTHLATLVDDALEQELLAVLALPRYAFFHPITRESGVVFIPEIMTLLENYNAALTRLGHGSVIEQQLMLGKLLMQHV